TRVCPLALPDALPIWALGGGAGRDGSHGGQARAQAPAAAAGAVARPRRLVPLRPARDPRHLCPRHAVGPGGAGLVHATLLGWVRSEEHTSELQSPDHL